MDATPCTEAGRPSVGGREWYIVHDDVWVAAGMKPIDPEDDVGQGGFLSIGCLEKRLRRKLTPQDFTSVLKIRLKCSARAAGADARQRLYGASFGLGAALCAAMSG
jgi:hypothetical protein